MEKLLSHLFLLFAGIAIALGNYWFTFGLWPKSWLSFFCFGLASALLVILRLKLEEHR